MAKPIKVLFLANNCVGVSYWRMYSFYEQMIKSERISAGIFGLDFKKLDGVMNWENEFMNSPELRNTVFNAVRSADVIVYGFSGHPMSIALCDMFREKFNKVFLVEIDDYVFGVPNYNPSFSKGFKPGCITEKIVTEQFKSANGFVTTVPYMRNEYIKYNSNGYVIPNSVDFDVWDKLKKGQAKNIRIGWIGGANHTEDIRLIKDVIPAILEKYNYVEFMFVHGVPNFIKDLKHPRIKVINTDTWIDIRKYPHFLSTCNFDIGLAPLLDNRFNRCKSNIKWLENACLKTPVVASDTEAYNTTIKHAETGFLAGSDHEWIDCLSSLIESPELRNQVGLGAYEKAREDYDIKKTTEKYIDVLNEVFENGQRDNKNRDTESDIGYGYGQPKMVGYAFK